MTESVGHVEFSAVSQPATPVDENRDVPGSSAKLSGAKAPRGKRILKFIQEWGGIATVLIAILYTFPFDAAGKFINWREQNLLDARKAIFDVAALYATGTAAVASVQDAQARFFLSNTYNIRIFNILKQNEAAIEGAKNQLLSSELYMVGSLYSLSGFPEAFTFYKRALEKAKTNDERVTIYREIGSARFTAGPNQDIDEARTSYLNALKLASKVSYLQMLYDQDLAELGGFELMNGDWECGHVVASYAANLLDVVAASPNAPQQLRDVDNFVHTVVASYPQPGSNQPSKGCSYAIPSFNASSNPPTQTVSTPQGPVSAQPRMTPPIPPPSIPGSKG